MQAVLQTLSGLSVTDLAGLLTARTLQILPRVAKYLVVFLFLVQIRSWPLVWHWRVWSPVFAIRGKFLLHKCSNLFRSPAARKQKNLEWLEGFSNIGVNPFEQQWVEKMWAGPDDCDFNMHLSNSSYPKHLDAARFKYGLSCGPTFFRIGGWMGLGATHFTFLREIPIFAHYEMRINLLTFDHKWMFIVTRFVTKPTGKGKGKKAALKPSAPAPTNSDNEGAEPHPSLRTATGLNTGTSTPLPTDTSALPSARALAAQLVERPEPDGAVLNCLAISEIVCKVGRITVPPALVYAMDGFCRRPPADAADAKAGTYSHENLPPHWERVRALRGDAHPGLLLPAKPALKALKHYYTHGWREEPEDQRWWEQALGGEVEERRLKALAAMQGLRRGMEEARAF